MKSFYLLCNFVNRGSGAELITLDEHHDPIIRTYLVPATIDGEMVHTTLHQAVHTLVHNDKDPASVKMIDATSYAYARVGAAYRGDGWVAEVGQEQFKESVSLEMTRKQEKKHGGKSKHSMFGLTPDAPVEASDDGSESVPSPRSPVTDADGSSEEVVTKLPIAQC